MSRDSHVIHTQATKKVLSVLDQLSQWVDEIPAVDQPQRFGNIAFRSWLDKVKAVSFLLLFLVDVT